MSTRIALWSLLFLSLSFAVDPAGALSPDRLDPLLQALHQAQTGGEAPKRSIGSPQLLTSEGALDVIASFQGSPKHLGGSHQKLNILLGFDGRQDSLTAAGLDVVSKIGSVYAGVLDAARLSDLLDVRGIRYVQLSQRLTAAREPLSPNEADAPAQLNPSDSWTVLSDPAESGAGSLVAFIDTGVDVFHSDFRKADGSTRIKYLLDLSNPGDVNGDGRLDGPDDLGGTLFTANEINLILGSSRESPTKDTTGHGTHGLSIAAGDDPTRPGIAPAADLIVVKATRKEGSLEFQSSDILGALSFVDRKATELKKPYVVNLSLGTIFASHDGRSLEEIAIDTLTGRDIPGKVVVLAAGNAADNRGGRFRHFSGQAFAGMASSHTLTLPAYSAPLPGSGNDQILLDIWYEGSDHLAITVTAPDQATQVRAAYGEIVDVATSFGQVFIVNFGGVNPLNGDTEAVVFIYDKDGNSPQAGDWKISLAGEEINESGIYHGWLAEGSGVGDAVPRISQGGDNLYLIAKPGGALHGLTVGSFARQAPGSRFLTSWTDLYGRNRVDPSARPEDISNFSSTGTTRDGRIKPEIVAPGEQVVGAVSQDAYPGRSSSSIYAEHPFPEIDALILSEEPERAFGILQGTSFSAPVVTGMVALLLSADPRLDAIGARNILVNRALQDSFTGKLPNDQWGYGKLDLSIAESPGKALSNRLRIDQDLLPEGAPGKTYSFALTASGGRLPYSWSVVKGALPTGLQLSSGSLLGGKPTAPGVYTFTLEARDSTKPKLVARAQFSLTIRAHEPLNILAEPLPPGHPGEAYSHLFTVEGGLPPYTWFLAGGSPPPGLILTPRGEISGIAKGTGRFSFTLRVADSSSAALRSFTLKVGGSKEGEWLPLGWLSGNGVKAILIDPNNPERLYAATDDIPYHLFTDIVETTDGGETWNSISYNGSFSGKAADLEFDPTTSTVWTLDAAELPLAFDPSTRAWRRWSYCGHDQQPADSSGPTRVDDIEIDNTGGIHVYAHNASCPGQPSLSRPQSILSSTDHGATWRITGELPLFSPVQQPDNRSSFLDVYSPNPQFMYLGRGFRCGSRFCNYPPEAEQFFSTSSGGASWAQRAVDIGSVIVPVVSERDPLDVLRFGWDRVNRGNGRSFLERSRDGGVTWEAATLPDPWMEICLLERSRSNPEIVLAGTSTGVFLSRNHGRNWSPLRLAGLPDETPNLCESGALAIDSGNPDHIWLGTPVFGIYESTNGGGTWIPRNKGFFRRRSSGLAIRPDLPSDLFSVPADDPATTYITRTAGERWIQSNGQCGTSYCDSPATPVPYSFPVISPHDAGYYLYLHWSGNILFRSDNRGVNWSSIYPDFNGEAGEHFFESIASDPFDSDILLARVSLRSETIYEASGMWRSADRGATWIQVGNAGESPTGNQPQARWESGVVFAQDVEGRAYALGADGLYRSDDRGDSWNRFVPLPRSSAYESAVVETAPSDSRYVYIARRDSVMSWDPIGRKLESVKLKDHYIVSLAVDPTDPRTAYLGMDLSLLEPSKPGSGGIWKTTNTGKTWNRMPGFPENLSVISLVADPLNNHILYAATREDGIFKTIDGGQNWTRLDTYTTIADDINMVIPYGRSGDLIAATQGFGVQIGGGRSFGPLGFDYGLENLNVRTVAIDPEESSSYEPDVYAGTESGLFKYIGPGGVTSGWLATGLTDVVVTDIAIETGAKPRRIKITTFGGVAVSEDGGKTFKRYTSGLGSLMMTSIANEVRGSSIRTWVTMRGKEGVAYSDDGGKTWKPAGGNGLRDRNVNDLVIEPPPSHRIWVATDSGVFYSNNAGLSWNELSVGLPSGAPVSSITIDPNTGEVLVSLLSHENGGVYRGGNLNGSWSALNSGLADLSVRRLTHDGGHSLDAEGRATTFYAATSTGAYSIEVRAAESTLRILTDQLKAASAGQAYNDLLSAEGGVLPYSWSIGSGAFPPGLALGQKDGSIVGVPVRPGMYSFSVLVTDGNSRIARRELTIYVQ
jgi:photosystem II stability/assembly factor-like uncharacterized protein